MTDFDRLMGDSLKAIRDDHVRDIETQIPAARRQIAFKLRARHFTFVIGGLTVAAAAVAVGLFIAQSPPKLDRSDPLPPAGTPTEVVQAEEVPPQSRDDAFALWPETTPEEAAENCLTIETFRSGPGQTAATFAVEELGWTDVKVRPSGADIASDGHRAFDVHRQHVEDPPRVTILVREVKRDCWSVVSVNSPVRRGAPTSLSVNKHGGRLTVAFDLAVRGLEESAATIRIPVEDGSVSMTANEFREKGSIEGIFRHLSTGRPSGFLVLIEDRDEQVIGAIGMALPAGDFSAG